VTRLLVLGTRTFAVEVADLASDAGFEVVGFVENLDPERCREPLEGIPVRWVGEIADLAATHQAICGLATTRRRVFADQVAALGLGFATLVHPSARVSRSATIGEGAIVGAGVVVGARAAIGRHVILNRGALIGHHTLVGDYVSVQPGANVAGACRIGAATYVGMGAIVVDQREVGAGSVVGAGAVVTKDVPDRVQVVGVPAHVVREGIDPL
jgi:UDP-perosamine 4-acetyltransferase